MCQMYAIFEEVVGPKPSSVPEPDEEEDQGIVLNEPAEPEQDLYGCKVKRKHQRLYSHYGTAEDHRHYHRYSSSLPRTRRRQTNSSIVSDTESTISTSSNNPLLDTISVLTYDPPDDSDDYYDLYNRCRSKDRSSDNTKSPSKAPGEGDRDSIGYAGSSSIDSGYKSFCPTPEIPVDSSVYGNESRTYASGIYDEGSRGNAGGGKPRIMMGTKVMNRQASPATAPTNSTATPSRESPCNRRSDSSLYDVNLDHLMYLRQSLLSAIQKCESTNNSCSNVKLQKSNSLRRTDHQDSIPIEKKQEVTPPTKPSPTEDVSTSAVSTTSATYQKTVRFNTDVKVTTLSPPEGEGDEVKPVRTLDNAKTEVSPNKVQSKSILKDPLCANLRSQLEAGAADCTLEEEIDSLLYGRAEFYDLESVDDFPCSYVTMIEEKYRSGKPSLAKVRKLKAGKSQEAVKPPPPEEGQTSTSSETSTNSQKTAPADSQTSTVSMSKTAKYRFTEVARCMLEIIEDLQLKKLQPHSSDDKKDSAAKTTSTSTPTQADGDKEEKPLSGNFPNCNLSCYASAAEYHVYEEIAYDYIGVKTSESTTVADLRAKADVPPPLPARPNGLIPKGTKSERKGPTPKGATIAVRAPSPPPRKSRCPLRRGSALTEVRNRPKQRGNLYCLFADRLERRNISRSLEREWRHPKSELEDDYGFRKEFPSI